MKKLDGAENSARFAVVWKSLPVAVLLVATAISCSSKEDGSGNTQERQAGASASSSHGQPGEEEGPEPQILLNAKKLPSQGLCAQALPKLLEELAENVEDHRFHNTICQGYVTTGAKAGSQELEDAPLAPALLQTQDSACVSILPPVS